MTWTLTTSGACVEEAGIYANDSLKLSGSYLNSLDDKAEATICALTHKDWVAAYASLNANLKTVLSDVVSQMVAIKMIKSDMSGFTSLTEAQTMLDIMQNNVNQGLIALEKEKIQDTMA